MLRRLLILATAMAVLVAVPALAIATTADPTIEEALRWVGHGDQVIEYADALVEAADGAVEATDAVVEAVDRMVEDAEAAAEAFEMGGSVHQHHQDFADEVMGDADEAIEAADGLIEGTDALLDVVTDLLCDTESYMDLTHEEVDALVDASSRPHLQAAHRSVEDAHMAVLALVTPECDLTEGGHLAHAHAATHLADEAIHGDGSACSGADGAIECSIDGGNTSVLIGIADDAVETADGLVEAADAAIEELDAAIEAADKKIEQAAKVLKAASRKKH